MKEKTPEQIFKEAREESPYPEQRRPALGPFIGQKEDSSAVGHIPNIAKWDGEHPLGYSIKRAKMEIARILTDADNLEKLNLALQTEFDENPVKFLLTFEPLLSRFEARAEKLQERKGVRIIIDGKAAIES